MWKQNISYTTSKEANKLTITASVSLPGFNKIVLTILSTVVIPVTLIGLWWMILANNAPFAVYIFIIFMSAALLYLMYFSYKSFKVKKWVLTVDKVKQTIQSDGDQFESNFKDIKEIKIIDKVSTFLILVTIPLFKFILTDGEKTLMYPLESYNRATELKKLIDEAIK